MYTHLKELRESLGMTQEEFGKSIGIAKSTYNNYEKGVREPKSDFWIAVAEKYGVTIDYLMGFSNDPHKYSQDSDTAWFPFDDVLIQLWGNASDEAKQVALALLEKFQKEDESPLSPVQEPPARTDADIEREVEDFRRRLILEKNQGGTSSPSSGAGAPGEKRA